MLTPTEAENLIRIVNRVTIRGEEAETVAALKDKLNAIRTERTRNELPKDFNVEPIHGDT